MTPWLTFGCEALLLIGIEASKGWWLRKLMQLRVERLFRNKDDGQA